MKVALAFPGFWGSAAVYPAAGSSGNSAGRCPSKTFGKTELLPSAAFFKGKMEEDKGSNKNNALN